MATSAFGLGRRCWSSPQQCHLHCLRTYNQRELAEGRSIVNILSHLLLLLLRLVYYTVINVTYVLIWLNSYDFWCWEIIGKSFALTHVNLGPLVFISSTPPSPVPYFWEILWKWVFYGLDVLPANQPSVSIDWREHKVLTQTSGMAYPFSIHNRTAPSKLALLHQYKHCFSFLLSVKNNVENSTQH